MPSKKNIEKNNITLGINEEYKIGLKMDKSKLKDLTGYSRRKFKKVFAFYLKVNNGKATIKEVIAFNKKNANASIRVEITYPKNTVDPGAHIKVTNPMIDDLEDYKNSIINATSVVK